MNSSLFYQFYLIPLTSVPFSPPSVTAVPQSLTFSCQENSPVVNLWFVYYPTLHPLYHDQMGWNPRGIMALLCPDPSTASCHLSWVAWCPEFGIYSSLWPGLPLLLSSPSYHFPLPSFSSSIKPSTVPLMPHAFLKHTFYLKIVSIYRKVKKIVQWIPLYATWSFSNH